MIAPLSASFLDPYIADPNLGPTFQEVWRYTQHLNLDDMDFAEDGFFKTIKRVIGRRGLAAWRVTKICGKDGKGNGIGNGTGAGTG